MMRFSTLLKHPADWMTGATEESGVVLTSRVRLARNLQREPFPGWSTKERRVSVLGRVKPEVEALPEMKNGFSQELDGLTSLQKRSWTFFSAQEILSSSGRLAQRTLIAPSLRSSAVTRPHLGWSYSKYSFVF